MTEQPLAAEAGSLYANTQRARDEIGRVIAGGPFDRTWESLAGYRVPEWYLDGKFGIFIHWGPYAVAGFGNEWYPRNMYLRGNKAFEHHVATYGPQSQFGYKDLITQFTADRFDPDEWAALFRRAGAQFVVPVAEHHDGFAMYDTALSEWNAARMGPKRDVIGELAAAVRRQWMVFGLSSHRAEHWWFFDEGMKLDSDVRDPRYAGLYGPAQPRNVLQPTEQFLEDWLLRTCELVDKYQPQLVWFDWWIEQPAFAPYLRDFASYYYNRGAQWKRGVAINYKHDAFPEGTAVFDVERGQLAEIRPHFWQTDTSVSKTSWGYVHNHEYKTATSLIHDLVDIVSKNGALLLNIGPRADGTIPEPEQDILRTIGDWLAVNGEAVYGTRPWTVYGEGPTAVASGSFTDTKRQAFTAEDVRFTTRTLRRQGRDVPLLYATVLSWPEAGAGGIAIRSLGTGAGLLAEQIQKVELLGHRVEGTPAGQLGIGAEVQWTRDGEALRIHMPDGARGEHAAVFRITLAASQQ
jgi:alpha-L-fucosidase